MGTRYPKTAIIRLTEEQFAKLKELGDGVDGGYSEVVRQWLEKKHGVKNVRQRRGRLPSFDPHAEPKPGVDPVRDAQKALARLSKKQNTARHHPRCDCVVCTARRRSVGTDE